MTWTVEYVTYHYSLLHPQRRVKALLYKAEAIYQHWSEVPVSSPGSGKQHNEIAFYVLSYCSSLILDSFSNEDLGDDRLDNIQERFYSHEDFSFVRIRDITGGVGGGLGYILTK